MRKDYAIRLFVDNEVGVLDRIAILVRRAGWNICGIHACEEPLRNGTRVILTIAGKADLRLLLNQFERLDCVRELSWAAQHDVGGRELAIARSEHKEALAEVASQYKAQLVEDSPAEAVYELSGTEQLISAFLEECIRTCDAKTMRTGIIYC